MKAIPRILLVDDVDALRRGLARLFRRNGWEVSEAGDGVEALESLRAGSFDVLLTDMRMPRMDGMELLVALRQELGSELPAIVLSGYHDHPAERLDALGVVEVLDKPVEPAALLEACARAVGGP